MQTIGYKLNDGPVHGSAVARYDWSEDDGLGLGLVYPLPVLMIEQRTMALDCLRTDAGPVGYIRGGERQRPRKHEP